MEVNNNESITINGHVYKHVSGKVYESEEEFETNVDDFMCANDMIERSALFVGERTSGIGYPRYISLTDCDMVELPNFEKDLKEQGLKVWGSVGPVDTRDSLGGIF